MKQIGLLGHGVVGSGVQQIIDARASEETAELCVKKILVKDEAECSDPRCTTDVREILEDPEIDAVAECMGGIEPAHSFVKEALCKGKHAVTSNKKMLAETCADLFETAGKSGVSLHYEAACGGGIPWMAALARTKRIDEISSFRGIFNGTTNYILSRMKDEGKDFDEMLREAQKAGYAERDPSDDIDGYDVRYKVVLSMVKAFGILADVKDIPVFGIRHIQSADMDNAAKAGYTIKMIGSAENKEHLEAYVMPCFVKNSDMFASVPLNFNLIESDSPTLGPASYFGQGAGSLPTAHAVVQDLIDICHQENCEIPVLQKGIPENTGLKKFYIRTQDPEAFKDILDRDLGGAFVTKEISLETCLSYIHACRDEKMFIAEVSR